MGHSAAGTAASQAGPPGPQLPGTVRLAGMLTLSCLASQAGQTIVTFAGDLDAASADQAYGYVRDAIDARGGQVLPGPWTRSVIHFAIGRRQAMAADRDGQSVIS